LGKTFQITVIQGAAETRAQSEALALSRQPVLPGARVPAFAGMTKKKLYHQIIAFFYSTNHLISLDSVTTLIKIN